VPGPGQIAREHLGRLFTERRTELGLTQEKVAARLRIQTADYRAIELGRRGFSLARIEEIAAALDLPPTAFFQDAREPARVRPRGRPRKKR